MIKNHQLWKWLVDVTLFIGLILAALLDLTGLPIHQWLGLGVGLLAGYHLLAHWSWVKSVSGRLVSTASGQARRFFLVDAGLFTGFSLILVTGLAMSTWFDLALAAYERWNDLHVIATIVTLALTVVKVGLHWRWVVNVGRRITGASAQPAVKTAPVIYAARGKTKPAVLWSPVDSGRRDFLRLMGVVGAAAVVAAYSALDGQEQAAAQQVQSVSTTIDQSSAQRAATSTPSVQQSTVQPAAPDTAQPTAASSQIASQTPAVEAASANSSVAESNSCFVQCNRRCSYPGRCRRYRDSNGNGRCDFGECA